MALSRDSELFSDYSFDARIGFHFPFIQNGSTFAASLRVLLKDGAIKV
jgi:hypothetical protein